MRPARHGDHAVGSRRATITPALAVRSAGHRRASPARWRSRGRQPGRRRRCVRSRRPHPPEPAVRPAAGDGPRAARPADGDRAGGGGNNRAMGRTVTAAAWPGGSGTATRAPGGRGERSVGWRVRVVPGLGGNRTGFVRGGSEHPAADAPASQDREPPRRLVSRSHVSIRAHIGELVPGGILHAHSHAG